MIAIFGGGPAAVSLSVGVSLRGVDPESTFRPTTTAITAAAIAR